ncbi:MAG: leucine-rich repeat protein, partial [Alistipes sp.]|nr:leucine-rich repeat protein [Alistipes sp.]
MKKLLTAMLGLAALGFVGCVQDPGELEVSVSLGGAPQINIDGSINQEYVSRVDDGGFCTGDQIGLYGVNYTENNSVAGELLDEGNQVDNACYTFDAEKWAWTSRGSIYYKDAETNIDLYGYYPYASPTSVRAYEFEVLQDQSGKSTIDGYSQSDFLWGKAENIAPTENKVKLRFNHRLASAKVVLVESDGFAEGEFESLKKQVLVLNTQRKAIIDLQTGAVEATGEVESEGIVMKSNEEGFRAVVVPQTMPAGTALFAITLNGINYRFKNSSTDVTYKSGMQTNFTINLKKKAHSGEYELSLVDVEIVDWEADLEAHGDEARQYFVVKMDEPGTLGAKIRAAKKNPAKIKNLKISGKIHAADFMFMRDSMTILQAINLKETEITPSWRYNFCFAGENNWHDEYFSGIKPEDISDCTAAVRERYPDKTITSWSTCQQCNYADEIPANAFYGKASLVYFCFPEKVTKVGSAAFSGTLLSGALIIPNDVTEIENNAFQRTNITSLQLPHGLKSMGDYAFAGCSSLSGTLSLPESLESIGERCFEQCSMLTGNLVLPSKLKKITDACFISCSGFTGDLVIPEGVTEIGEWVFYSCGGFTGSLTLPKSLKNLSGSRYAFCACNFQGELVIPSQIQVIPSNCFQSCDFSSIVFAENSELIKIEESAFNGNSRLSEPVILPEGLLTIEGSAFVNCSQMPSIVLPKSL